MHNLKAKISCFPQLDWLIVLTSQSQGEGWWLDILWRDWSTGVRSSMLLVKAVDDHPLLIGAEVQSIPVCRVTYHLYGLRDGIPFENKSQYMLWTALCENDSIATCTVNAPVQCKAPSWSSTSSGLTTYKHSLPKAKHVGGSCWVHLHLEVWTHKTFAHTQRDRLHETAAEVNTRLSYLRCYSSITLCEPTCYIKFDGVRGGPPAQWLVRLKPEVVLACITQLHNPNLDRAAGIAASDVAGAIQQQVTIHFSDISAQYATFKKTSLRVFSHRVRPRYDRLISLGSVWWVNSLRPSADTRNHMTRFTVWPVNHSNNSDLNWSKLGHTQIHFLAILLIFKLQEWNEGLCIALIYLMGSHNGRAEWQLFPPTHRSPS